MSDSDTTNSSVMPEIGEVAPDFGGQTQDGDSIRLSDYRGQRVVLYFYPKDDTPGCTKQACSLRDGWGRLQEEGIQVIGVSKDDVGSHNQFAEKYDLPFPLVADPDHDILAKYGVWQEQNRFGNTYMGTRRTTFLIDGDGIIRDILRRPDTENHADEVLRRWNDLEAAGR